MCVFFFVAHHFLFSLPGFIPSQLVARARLYQSRLLCFVVLPFVDSFPSFYLSPSFVCSVPVFQCLFVCCFGSLAGQVFVSCCSCVCQFKQLKQKKPCPLISAVNGSSCSISSNGSYKLKNQRNAKTCSSLIVCLLFCV